MPQITIKDTQAKEIVQKLITLNNWTLDKSSNRSTTCKITQNGKVAILSFDHKPRVGYTKAEYRLSFKAEGRLDKGATTAIIEDDSVYDLIKHIINVDQKETAEAMSVVNDFFA
jgi:hypothetical protein